jgi:FAD/FMN-containing dehydrogenase
VTAGGEVVRASEDENAELFWGLRGGGGNFGVVTEFEFEAYPVGPEVSVCFVFYPLAAAMDVLGFYRDWFSEAPDEVSGIAFTGIVPQAEGFPDELHGEECMAMLATHCGSIRRRPKRHDAGRCARSPKPLVDMSGHHARTLTCSGCWTKTIRAHELRYYWKSTFVQVASTTR